MSALSGLPGQARAFADLSRDLLGDAVTGVYLHGSIVTRGLRHQSDLDLLLVTSTPVLAHTRAAFLSELMALSARHPDGPDAPRCLDVLAVRSGELAAPRYPGHAEFIYGEWLRREFEEGNGLLPFIDPVVTLLLAQGFQEARAVFGPPLPSLMTAVDRPLIARAMRDSLQPLLDSLAGDERNVLLTLARMWRTSIDGTFVAKDIAADWAADLSPPQVAEVLRTCSRAYRGDSTDDWSAGATEAAAAAAFLRARLLEALPPAPHL